MKFVTALKLARHWFWIAPLVLGVVFIGAGVYMALEGRAAHDDVRDTVVQENITVSGSEGELVDDADSAQAQSDAILEHTLADSGGYLYADEGRFLLPEGNYMLPKGTFMTEEGGTTTDVALAATDADGNPIDTTTDQTQAAINRAGNPVRGWTNNAELAAKSESGSPIPNPLRDTALTSASLRTSLGVAVMGFRISDLVTGLGLFLVFIGVTHILFLAPAVYWAAEIANEREGVKKEVAARTQATQPQV